MRFIPMRRSLGEGNVVVLMMNDNSDSHLACVFQAGMSFPRGLTMKM